MDQTIAEAVPAALRHFMSGACGLPVDSLHGLRPEELPEPARDLLDHPRDMTSTLAAFHGSSLRVEVLQQQRVGDCYLREVFLRTIATDAIVEYGVIAIMLERFTPEQQEAISAGRVPLGGLLHQFQIPFESAPIGFGCLPPRDRSGTALAAFNHEVCYGRFNQLATPAGEPLAWILEILPPPPPGGTPSGA